MGWLVGFGGAADQFRAGRPVGAGDLVGVGLFFVGLRGVTVSGEDLIAMLIACYAIYERLERCHTIRFTCAVFHPL